MHNSRVNGKVNYRLWMIMMSQQCRFINCNKYAILVWGLLIMGEIMHVDIWEISVTFQIYCEPNTALKD